MFSFFSLDDINIFLVKPFPRFNVVDELLGPLTPEWRLGNHDPHSTILVCSPKEQKFYLETNKGKWDLDPVYYRRILKPFIKGDYTEIDVEYMKKYPMFVDSPKNVGVAFLIFTKHELMREYWEAVLDVSIKPDAQVWSKPKVYFDY